MKAKDGRRVSTLRLVKRDPQECRYRRERAGKGPLGDDAVLGVLQKMIKQRHESVETLRKGRPRPSWRNRNANEIVIINGLSAERRCRRTEVKAAIAQAMQGSARPA